MQIKATAPLPIAVGKVLLDVIPTAKMIAIATCTDTTSLK
jgi:hypothetical protein